MRSPRRADAARDDECSAVLGRRDPLAVVLVVVLFFRGVPMPVVLPVDLLAVLFAVDFAVAFAVAFFAVAFFAVAFFAVAFFAVAFAVAFFAVAFFAVAFFAVAFFLVFLFGTGTSSGPVSWRRRLIAAVTLRPVDRCSTAQPTKLPAAG